MSRFNFRIDTKILKKHLKKVLRDSSRNGVKVFRAEIDRLKLFKTGKLRQNVIPRINKKSISFKLDTDYADILNRGVRKHRMTYLSNASSPIPFIDGKRRSYRTVGNKIGKTGKWVHPGFKRGKGFINRSVDKIVRDISDRIAKLDLS